ncbi:methylenetetrahydrofolate reductase [Corynebacterium frankenforstense]
MPTGLLYSDYRPGTPTEHPTVSFELYPPRNPSKVSGIWAGVNKLATARPDYVSVTYGAGGSGGDTRDTSVQVLLNMIDRHPGLPAVAHLTCLGSTPAEMTLIIRLLLRAGVRDFLALRGDPPADDPDYSPTPGTLTHAAELVELIRKIAADELPHGVGTGPGGSGAATAPVVEDYVSIGVAAYPASRGAKRDGDLAALTNKARAGADFAITQVFYDPEDYISLVRELAFTGVRLPIVPGILPLHDLRRLRAMERLAGIPVPAALEEIHATADPALRVRRALGATAQLMTRVLDAGAPGVHLYTFNRPRPTLDLLEYLRAAGYLRHHASAVTGRPGTAGALGGADPARRQAHRIARGQAVDSELVGLALGRLTPAV